MLRGLQGATDLFDVYSTASPDFHLTFDDLVAEGNFAWDKFELMELYVGEDMAFRIQKFVPMKDGKPVQIIGRLMQ